MKAEDASLNEKVFMGRGSDHGCYDNGSARQDQVEAAFQMTWLAEQVAAPFWCANEAGVSLDELKDLDTTWCLRFTRSAAWEDSPCTFRGWMAWHLEHVEDQ